MKGDFTRDTFDPMKHFSRVLSQQGRVTLDADSNEQTAILLHYLRTLTTDLIGPYAAPANGVGFQLTDVDGVLTVTAGRYYVGGILVENHHDCAYNAQPYWKPAADDGLLKDAKDQTGKVYWLYLDVWERHITAIEDDSIREAALGGPDTSTRAQVVWQVKAQYTENATLGENGEISGAMCGEPLADLPSLGRAQLAARVDPGHKIEDACVTPPESKFRGLENQLYRVEIHEDSNSGKPTFKWSRENGSVATAWLGREGNDLRVKYGRGFSSGEWVELTDDLQELQGRHGVLVKLTKVEGDRLSVDPANASTIDALKFSELVHPKVRRWDQKANDNTVLLDGAVPVKERTVLDPLWIDLENGVQVEFSPSGEYRTGDYWLIPARVAGGTIEWPTSLDANGKQVAEARPPRGVEHFYAPLGFVAWSNQTLNLMSCQCLFYPSRSCANFDFDRAPIQPADLRRAGTAVPEKKPKKSTRKPQAPKP
jgi:hypothetical protein